MLPRIAALVLLIGLVKGPLPEHLRAWGPLLELGDREQPLTSAVVRVASLAKLAEAVTHNLQIDRETQTLFDNVGRNIETLDPKSMYRMIGRSAKGAPDADGKHAMSVFGELSNKGEYRVVGRRQQRPNRFGDLRVTIAMKPALAETYLLETDVTAHLEVTADELTGVLAGAMTWLQDTANTHRARAGEGLDDADRAVGRGLASAFPAMVALAERYFEPLDGVARSPGGVRGRIIGRFKSEAFAKDYPKLGELLTEDVKAKVRAKVTSIDGRTLAVLKLDGSRGEVSVIFEVEPERWVTERFKVEADVDAELFGMRLQLAKVEVNTKVDRQGEAIVLRSVYDRTPKIEISGAALGIVPIALVDLVIPSNVEAIAEQFLGTLARTEGGRGARVDVVLPADRAQPLRFSSRAELLNNGFVSFWLKVGSSQIFGDGETLEEMQRLQKRALAAFSSDFARFQDQTL